LSFPFTFADGHGHGLQVSGDDTVTRLRGKKAKKSAKRLRERKAAKGEASSVRAHERSATTGFEHLRDRVRFGDVVEAPPKLTQKAPLLKKHVRVNELQHLLDRRLAT
jgi:hypothetical protein